MTDAELLAIILRTGTQEMNVFEMAQQLLKDHNGSLFNLYEDCDNLIHHPPYKGFGTTKGITLAAALEIGIRVSNDRAKRLKTQMRIEESSDIYDLVHPHLFGLNHEELWLVTVAASGIVTSTTRISTGGINETTADIKLILRHAIMRSATSIVLVHNHPGGSTNPSIQDNDLTRRLLKATNIMGLHFLDHLIFTDTSYYSYADNGNIL